MINKAHELSNLCFFNCRKMGLCGQQKIECWHNLISGQKCQSKQALDKLSKLVTTFVEIGKTQCLDLFPYAMSIVKLASRDVDVREHLGNSVSRSRYKF